MQLQLHIFFIIIIDRRLHRFAVKAKQCSLGIIFCVMLCFKQIVFNVKHFIAFKNNEIASSQNGTRNALAQSNFFFL